MAEPTHTTRTTCPYCGVGCGVLAMQDADGSLTIKGNPDHPANFGRLCSKGSALAETVGHDGRLLYPHIGTERADWDTALNLVADRFASAIAEHGPDSVAFYVSGQILTEDYYVANKLMKGFIGSANIDTNSRLCMASSVAGHRRAFGKDTVPGTYEDLELADLVVLTGSNLAWCHPVLYQRLAAAKQERPSMKVVLIDPRRTTTANIADIHLAIRPDSDVTLFNGLLAHLAECGAIDSSYVGAHTSGYSEALGSARQLTLSDTAALTGLREDVLAQFYRLFASTEKVVTVYSQGVNQSACGTDKVNAIINCHLATGRIGRLGMGPLSVTGQPNAMGGREVGGLANMLAAHMDLENGEHRKLVQDFWQSPVIADKPGLKAVDLFRAVGEGKIKALWIMATNPVVSMPEADLVKEALATCPFVVVSDVECKTDTLDHAHVQLPALAWGEKSGTVTNSERRISRQRGFIKPPGKARADWWQICEVAKRMGFAEAFSYAGPAEIFAEYAALTAHENEGSRDLDLGAHAQINADAYDALTPFQWPAPAQGKGRERFFADGGFYTADSKARFIPVQATAGIQTTQLTLNTGRVRDHWHTMTRTGRSPRLGAHMGEPYVEIHPRDALAHGLRAAELARVSNELGNIIVRVLISERQQQGSIFVPMHWTAQTASNARVDLLVHAETDPVSGQPASKSSTVEIAPWRPDVYGFSVSRGRPSTQGLDYWALAKTEGGWRLEFAIASQPTSPRALAAHIIGCKTPEALIGYSDHAGQNHRYAGFGDGKLAGAVFLAPEPVAVSRSILAGELAAKETEPSQRWRVLAGMAGADRPDPGAIVCSCFSVGVNQIAAAVRSGECSDVKSIGVALSAGTNCGSCRSEIAAIIDANKLAGAAE